MTRLLFKVSRRKFLMLIGLFLPFTDWLTDNINAFQSIQLTNSPAKLLKSIKNQIFLKYESQMIEPKIHANSLTSSYAKSFLTPTLSGFEILTKLSTCSL